MTNRLIEAILALTQRARFSASQETAVTFRNGKALPNDPLSRMFLS